VVGSWTVRHGSAKKVCEVKLTGVRVDSVFAYTAGQYRLRFRRDTKLSELLCCKIALEGTELNYRSLQT
jgi:hypothetical protein